jgi:hypothetical protein
MTVIALTLDNIALTLLKVATSNHLKTRQILSMLNALKFAPSLAESSMLAIFAVIINMSH